MEFIQNLVEKYYDLDTYAKIGVWVIISMITIVMVGVVIELGVQYFGFKTGEGLGFLGIHWHHSRQGAILGFVGAATLILTTNKIARYIAGALILIGVGLLIHHLTTEQCFSIYGICIN